MESIIIRNAQECDLPQIEALEIANFSRPWPIELLRRNLPSDRHEFLVAVRGEEVLGYIGMLHVMDEGYISNVAVAPDHRRRGIGDLLITQLLERARIRELSFVTLEVREHNAPAIALYQKHGFAPVGLRKNYYQRPVENALLMTKYLK